MYQGFKTFFRFSAQRVFASKSKLLLAGPLLLTLPTAQAFFWNSKKPNQIDDRIHIDVEVSNKPCEDRSAKKQL